MSSENLTPRPVTLPRRALTSAEFSQLEDVPPETEWFANIGNPHTRRAYRNDLKEFMNFTGIRTPIELRLITRAHVIAWRKDLDRRKLAAGSIRRKLSALSSLYDFLTDQNAVPTNPVKGVKRPKVDSYEGKTPAIADKEARQLLDLPNDKSLKGLRDRALLATLLYQGLRREELCRLKIKNIHPRRGVPPTGRGPRLFITSTIESSKLESGRWSRATIRMAFRVIHSTDLAGFRFLILMYSIDIPWG
jgi:integrase/recombinase XerD